VGSGRKKKGKGGGGADRRAPVVSAAGEKKKRGRGEEWAGAGRLMGRLAIWAEREQALVFFFFLFLFQTSFSNQNSFQIQIKPFQTFSQEFYKLFRNHTSNQKPCKPTDDAQTLVVSRFIKLYLIF
jgi:hypothetical protein